MHDLDSVPTHGLSEALDNQLVKHLRQGSVSYANFPDSPPVRCLDLGCGVRLFRLHPSNTEWFTLYSIQTGSWILEASREWPACEFMRSCYIMHEFNNTNDDNRLGST